MPSSSAISLWCVLAFLVQIQSLVLPPRGIHRRGTALASDLVDPSAVSDLVQGLDAAIGNPSTAADEIVQASTKAVDMAISDPTILAAGGVATLSIGLAAFLASNNDNKEDDGAGNETAVSPEVQAKMLQAVAAAREEIEVAEPDAESTGPDASSSHPAAEVASESKEPEPEPEEPESDVSMEAKEPEPEPQEEPEPEASMESAKSEEDDDEAEEAAEEEVAVDLEEAIDLSERLAEPRQRGLLLQRFLNKKTERLQKANQKLGRQKADLSNTEIRLQETQAQLSAVTRANQGLFTQYKNEKGIRQQVTEELSQTKQEMETLQQIAQADMDAMVEANQQLEDKFEFEQMEKKRRISELHETEWELDTTRKQLYKTSAELASVKDELAFTQKQVQDTSKSLKELKDDTKSMRKLTGNMWKLSKNRVKGIFRRNKQQE
ncbi:expressed unknown protein [Seminavis robusta]|uniref:Uncharacterized protein n=1 Tax=Seminavis robusta TaxID=568900 RepID=A0A9N8HX79_9STRA|nr:expressed unknown protein [Seminavis robusta]|eukprot:Sro2147_g316490.1 n/a (436) ;mRNA; r:7675-8982